MVIGTGGRHIAEADAWSHVAGLTLGQDISDRTVQLTGKPPQFSLGKSFDTFGPIGPALVSVDSFPDPDDIELWCDVAGERDAARDAPADLIFPVAALVVSYLSSICTLDARRHHLHRHPRRRRHGVAAGSCSDGELVDIGRRRHRRAAQPLRRRRRH